MGSEYCGTVFTAEAGRIEERFHQLVEDCLYTYGHGGYTGTFAEKDSVQVIAPLNGSPEWTQERARLHCQDNNDKWGPAYAYWLGGDRWYIGGWCSD